jgi:hypothetical protein
MPSTASFNNFHLLAYTIPHLWYEQLICALPDPRVRVMPPCEIKVDQQAPLYMRQQSISRRRTHATHQNAPLTVMLGHDQRQAFVQGGDFSVAWYRSPTLCLQFFESGPVWRKRGRPRIVTMIVYATCSVSLLVARHVVQRLSDAATISEVTGPVRAGCKPL